MHLTSEEEKALNGEFGETLSTAYRILLAIGNANEAEKLIPIKWAHVSGVNFNTIGKSGEEFLKEISSEGKRVLVNTTLNPMGFDSTKKNIDLKEEFISNQFSIIDSYKKLGVTLSFTCIPYELFSLPKKGDNVSFAESSAAVFLNSILNIKTNKESALSSLASAITGKVPYSDLLLEENRKSKIFIKPDLSNDRISNFYNNASQDLNELDFGLLGYYAGKVSKESCVGIDCKKDQLDIIKMKSLSAGMGTSGVCGMFKTEDNENAEKMYFGKKERENVFDELNTSENGNVIVLGSPQLGINEIDLLDNMLNGKKFKKKCVIFCAKPIYELAKKNKSLDRLENAGCEFFCDSCTCLTPLITKDKYDSIITNSVKCSYYMKHSNKVGVSLKNLKTIVKENAI